MAEAERILGTVKARQREARDRLVALDVALRDLEEAARRSGDPGLRLSCAAQLRLLHTLQGGMERLQRLPLAIATRYPDDVESEADRVRWDRALEIAGDADGARAVYERMKR